MKNIYASVVITLCFNLPVHAVDLTLCESCHNSKQDVNPIISGQHSKYIEKQLYDLKKDLRVHAQMQGIPKTLDDEQIKAISKAFASKKWANVDRESSQDVKDKGKRLVRVGNCTRCHGSELEGTYNIPRLAGQNPEYLKTTLIQYKKKERSNFPPMSSMLSRYSEEDIGIMSEYIASLNYQE